MKLSDETVTVLKNFSSINQSILVKEGSTLKTLSPHKTIFVEATVSETFPKEFAIFDLNKLLAKISLYKEAHLSFEEDRINIATENRKKSDFIKYCAPKLIVTPPERSITLGEPDFKFNLSQEDLDWMKKSAGISGSPNFVFESDGDTIHFIATDVSNDAADVSKIEIGSGDGKKFRIVMKVENFKLIEGSYEVLIAKKGLAMFKHSSLAINYYVAIEAAESSFGEE